MKYFIATLSFALVVSAASIAWARPLKGFNTGPYLYAEGGAIQVSFNKDEQTGQKYSGEFMPSIGLIFGWNIWDYLSAELDGRYTTNRTEGKREHLVSANVYGRYYFIIDQLTDSESFKVMPTVKGGFSFRIASLPGNPASADTALTTFGWGPSFGAGINFLVKKYLSFGVDAQEDLVFFQDKHQTLSSGAGALVYKGGFYPQFSVMGYIGVHY